MISGPPDIGSPDRQINQHININTGLNILSRLIALSELLQ